MKLSRLSLAALLLLVIASLSSCTESKEKGVAMAQDFVKAWNGDADSLNYQIEKINTTLDSITFKSPFVDAFIEEAADYIKKDMLDNLAFQGRLNRIEIIDGIIEKFIKAMKGE